MPVPSSVRFVIDQPFPAPDDCYHLKVYWTPADSKAEHMIILGIANTQREVTTRMAYVQQLLLYVYEQGRVDAALGF